MLKYLVIIPLLFVPLLSEARLESLREEINSVRASLFDIYLQRDLCAESYIVFNISQKKTASSKNVSEKQIIASITKLMSAVIAKENIDMQEKITITPPMLAPYGHSPALFSGSKVKARDLVKASLIQSTNDAAEALTYFLEKGKFVALMNKKATEIGMKNTFFYDAHGLSIKNKSTAHDIVKLLFYIYKKHPHMLEITKKEDFYMHDYRGAVFKFKNLNNFHEHSHFLGGKTGYLPEAKQTFASLFAFQENVFAVVVLCSEKRKEDIDIILQNIEKYLLPI